MQEILETINKLPDPSIYLLVVLFGFILQRAKLIVEGLTLFLSKTLVRILYPCLIFSSIVTQYDRHTLMQGWQAPFFTFMLILLGFILGKPLLRLSSGVRSYEKGTFRFMCCMPNYIFLPLPICQYYWGSQGVALLIFSTLGAEIAMWTLAIPRIKSGTKATFKNLFNPPFISLLTGLSIVIMGHPSWSQGLVEKSELLAKAGQGCIPVSMFLLGCHFGRTRLPLFEPSHQLISGFRLIGVPAIALFILYLSPFPVLSKKVLFLISTMPAAVASVIFSEIFGGSPKYAAQQVMLSHLLATVTIPIWLYYGIRLLS